MRTSLLSALGLAMASFSASPIHAQNCSNSAFNNFEIGLHIQPDAPSSDVQVRIYDGRTGQILSNLTRNAIRSAPLGTTDCHWIAHVGETAAQPGSIRLERATPYVIRFSSDEVFSDVKYEYYLCDRAAANELSSFYCPTPGADGDPDLLFYYTANGIEERAALTGSTRITPFFQSRGHDSWIMPYDAYTMCGASCISSNLGDLPFLRRKKTSGYVFDSSYDVWENWLVPSPASWSWADTTWAPGTDPTLRFRPGKKVTVKGTLQATGLIMKPIATSQTWGGIAVSNGTLTLTGSSKVEKSGTDGIYATGASASVTVTGNSEIRQSGGNGVRVNNGADATIEGGAQITFSVGSGVSARGSGSTVLVRNAFIQQGDGYATYADIYADIDLRNTPTAAKLNTNDAGVRAELAGQTDTGTAGGNRIVRDPNGPSQSGGVYQDVFTMDAAYVDVRKTYWGTGITSSSQLAIVDGEDNVVLVDPVLTTDPAGGPGLLRTSGTDLTRIAANGAVATGRTGAASARSGPFVSQAGTGTVQGWVEVAEGSTGLEAVDAIQSALDAAETEAERRMGWAAAARLAIRMKTRPALRDEAASARLDALAAASLLDDADGPWARRVLALSAFHGTSRSTMQGHLDALSRIPAPPHKGGRAEGASPLSHAAFAHLLTLRDALDMEDAPRALDALAALAAVDSYQAEIAEQDIRAVFPETEAATARIRETIRSEPAAVEALPLASSLAVGPNPTPGPTRVRVELAQTADVDLAIYDALGRRVRNVVQGVMVAGAHTANTDLSGLPAGVYLARLTTAGATQTVRFTVVR